MRTPARLGVLVALLLAVAPPADGQGILGRIKKRATDAVEKKAEDKVVEKVSSMMQRKVDATFDAVFGDSVNPAPGGAAAGEPGASGARSAGGTGTASAPHLPFSLGGNAKTESVYTFDVVTTMEFESTKGGSSEGKAVIQMYYNSKEPYSGTAIRQASGKKPEGDAFIVLDAKNKSMVMLVTDDKQEKASMAYDWSGAAKYADSVAATGTSAAQTPSERVNWDTVTAWRGFTKIGTKTIAGYTADGYRSESKDGTVELWTSRDPRLAAGRMFSASSNIKQMRGQFPADMPYGMLLELTSVDSQNGEKVTMRITSIETNARATYVMADYPRLGGGKK